MHYYYDVIVNLDETLWDFYEWENEDNLIPIKKIPLIRVSDRDLKNIMSYKVVINEDWVQNYLEKKTIKNSKERISLILLSNTKNCIVIELNHNGETLYRSKLLLEDENNCNELAYTLKETKIPYTIGKKIEHRHEFRQSIDEKRLLATELKTISKQNNVLKCTYLYYEWFGLLETDFTKMIQRCEQELKEPYNLKMHQIAQLVRLSYKERL